MSVDNYLSGLPFGAQTRNPFNYEKFEQIGRDTTTHWLTTTEIAEHLNLFEDESQDAYLKSLELATRFAIEDYLGLSIFPVTYRVYYGPESLVASPVTLDLPEVSQNINPASPGVTVNSIGYWNNASPSVFVTLASSSYSYDPSGNKVIVNNLPTDISNGMTAPIVVQYSTAASPLSAYPVIKQAGLLLFTHLYNNRSNTTHPIQHNIPFGVSSLLRPYKPLVM